MDSYFYGVFPYLPVNKLEEVHGPIAKRFARLLGYPVKLGSRPNYELFRNSVAEQAYDIIFIQPFGYIRAAAANGYIPVARFISPGDTSFKGTISSQFVTLADSDINHIDQLRHHIVAMPSADAAVSLLGIAYLKEHGLIDGENLEIRFLDNHFSCLQQLVIHKASACASALPAIRLFETSKDVKLNIIAISHEIPSSLIAVHRRVPESQRRLLQDEIIHWHKTGEGKAILARARLLGFIETSDKDYDAVREIWRKLRENE